MKIIYQLSNRQRKELLVRGVPITLALPAPPIEVDDYVDWSRSVLPAELRPHVVSAEIDEVRVHPGGRGDDANGLTGRIGVIRPEGAAPAWTVPIVVVLARLQIATPRNAAPPPQWPANVVIDGVPLLGRKDEG